MRRGIGLCNLPVNQDDAEAMPISRRGCLLDEQIRGVKEVDRVYMPRPG